MATSNSPTLGSSGVTTNSGVSAPAVVATPALNYTPKPAGEGIMSRLDSIGTGANSTITSSSTTPTATKVQAGITKVQSNPVVKPTTAAPAVIPTKTAAAPVDNTAIINSYNAMLAQGKVAPVSAQAGEDITVAMKNELSKATQNMVNGTTTTPTPTNPSPTGGTTTPTTPSNAAPSTVGGTQTPSAAPSGTATTSVTVNNTKMTEDEARARFGTDFTGITKNADGTWSITPENIQYRHDHGLTDNVGSNLQYDPTTGTYKNVSTDATGTDAGNQVIADTKAQLEKSLNDTQNEIRRQGELQMQQAKASAASETGASMMSLARMGALGTSASGVDYLNSLEQKHTQTLNNIQGQIDSAILMAQDQYNEKALDLAWKQVQRADSLRQEARQAEQARLDNVLKYHQIQKYESDELGQMFTGMVNDGKKFDDLPADYLKTKFPDIDESTARSLFSTTEKVTKATDDKSKMDALNSLYTTLNNIPAGHPVTIGKSTYYGTKGTGVLENDGAGNMSMIYVDQTDGTIKTQDMGKIGKVDAANWEMVTIDGKPAMFNKVTQEVKPITRGLADGNVAQDAQLDQFFPTGTQGGQCGSFVHSIVTDYPYGLDTRAQKDAAINVPKGSQLQVGDVVVQNIGGTTGHVSVINSLIPLGNGQYSMTLTESNLHYDGKVSNGRTLNSNSPTIDGYFRGTVNPKLSVGSDSAIQTMGATTNAPTPTTTQDTGRKTYTQNDIKVPSQGSFTSGLQTGATAQANATKEQEAVDGALALLNGDDTKGIPTTVLSRSKIIARANGWDPSSPDYATDEDINVAKSIADYSADISKVTSLRGDDRKKMMALVLKQNPDFDMKTYAQRQKFVNDWTSGNLNNTIISLNTTVDHMADMKASGDTLNNFRMGLANKGVNAVESWFGDPRRGNFDVDASAVANELTRVFRGTGGAEADIRNWQNSFSSSSSPEQIKGALQEGVKLMAGRLDALTESYKKSMGNYPSEPILKPESIEVLKGLGLDVTPLTKLNNKISKSTVSLDDPSVADKVSAARAAGYSDNEIKAYLNQ